jgi:hypothetical protein
MASSKMIRDWQSMPYEERERKVNRLYKSQAIRDALLADYRPKPEPWPLFPDPGPLTESSAKPRPYSSKHTLRSGCVLYVIVNRSVERNAR